MSEAKAAVLIFLEEEVKNMISPTDKINHDANLSTELGLDSLDAVELIMNCEKEYNIAIPDEEAEKLNTLNEIADYITEQLTKQQ